MASAEDAEDQSNLLRIDNDYAFHLECAKFLRENKKSALDELKEANGIDIEQFETTVGLEHNLAARIFEKLLETSITSSQGTIKGSQLTKYIKKAKIKRRDSQHNAEWVRELLTHVDWREMDQDNSMEVERSEFISFFAKKMDGRLAEAIFDTIDANGDGSLSALEYFRWRTAVKVEAIEEIMLRVLGESENAKPKDDTLSVDITSDDDGDADPSPLSPHNDDAALVFDILKTTNWVEMSGQDTILTEEEFVTFFKGTPLTPDTINKVFNLMDKNGDRNVSGAEFFAWKTNLTVQDIRDVIGTHLTIGGDDRANPEPAATEEPVQDATDADEKEDAKESAIDYDNQPEVAVPPEPVSEPEPVYSPTGTESEPVEVEPDPEPEREPERAPEPVVEQAPTDESAAPQAEDEPEPLDNYDGSEEVGSSSAATVVVEEKQQQQAPPPATAEYESDVVTDSEPATMEAPLKEGPRDSVLEEANSALDKFRRQRTKSMELQALKAEENVAAENQPNDSEPGADAEAEAEAEAEVDPDPPANDTSGGDASKPEEEQKVRRMWLLSKRGDHWREVDIIEDRGDTVRVHYVNYADKYDEDVGINDDRLKAERPVTGFIVGDNLSCWNTQLNQWREAEIKKVNKETNEVKVHYVSANIERDEWMSMDDSRLSATHKQPFDPQPPPKTNDASEEQPDAPNGCGCAIM